MKQVTSDVCRKLTSPDSDSHKGQNGRILVIAGSDTYHGSLLMTIQAASRIVDMVYVHSIEENLDLVQQLRSEISTFIAVGKKDVWSTVELVDAIIIGPGLEETDETVELTKKLLTTYPTKKVIVDATSFWHINPEWLHENVIAAPHSREFENVFSCHAQPKCVQNVAHKYGCTIVLTGPTDYISDGNELWENHTGNVGMTKGGTGDVLVGIVGALAATNDCLVSALAGTYINGVAGDRLYERVGTFYNAEDVITELGEVWKEYIG